MLHLTRRKDPLDRYAETDWYYEQDTFVWGRACKVSNTLYHIMQEPVTCKDYIVDTYYRTPISTNFTEEEKLQACYYIQVPKQMQENFIKNMTSFFWPYEDKHGFDRTVLQQVTRAMTKTKAKPFIIEVDKKWLTNTTILSMYLSLIRLCVYNTNMSESHLITKADPYYYCNENHYIEKLSKYTRPIWDFYVNNPTKMLIQGPTIHGYTKGMKLGHGVTGIFHMLEMMDYNQLYNPNKPYEIPVRSYVFTELRNIYLNELSPHVKPLPQLQ